MPITFLTNSSYTVFLTTRFFTTLVSLLKSKGVVFNSSISNLSKPDLKPAKSVFLTNPDESTVVAFFKFAFVA